MSDILVRVLNKPPKKLPKEEAMALMRTRIEARKAGASIKNSVGGLPPSLALGIFRRDQWTCKRCGTKSNLSLHHKGGIPDTKWSSKGKSNELGNLVVLCDDCHNKIHDEASDK